MVQEQLLQYPLVRNAEFSWSEGIGLCWQNSFSGEILVFIQPSKGPNDKIQFHRSHPGEPNEFIGLPYIAWVRGD